MILTTPMIDALSTIRRLEGRRQSAALDVPANEMGNQLIKLYYATSNLQSRELITDFMTQAGNVWLRKLLLRDTGPIESSEAPYASLDDYVNLLAANDDSMYCDLAG